MSKTLYHTASKGKYLAASVAKAPFFCVNNPWLGTGYYFWDSFIEMAHWWGEHHYHGNYIIIETDSPFQENEIFDLINNHEHIKKFANYIEILEEKTGKEITVPQAIEHMKKHTQFSAMYKAIRADGRLSISHHYEDNKPYIRRIKFNLDNEQYLDLLPPWQLCILNRASIPAVKLKYTSP